MIDKNTYKVEKHCKYLIRKHIILRGILIKIRTTFNCIECIYIVYLKPMIIEYENHSWWVEVACLMIVIGKISMIINAWMKNN